MTSTPAPDPAGTQPPKAVDLQRAASVQAIVLLALGQLFLIFLLATSRATLVQVMLSVSAECLVVWLLTTLFYSRTWKGVARRLRELVILAIVLAMCVVVFGFIGTPWSDGRDQFAWLEEIAAMLASRRFVYGLGYVVVLAAGWLVMAWQSGRASVWWAVNVAAPASVNFAAIFMAFFAEVLVVVFLSPPAEGHTKFGFDASRYAPVFHSIVPMALLIVYSLTRVFASWKMVTGFSEEDWRKSVANLYFDRPADQA